MSFQNVAGKNLVCIDAMFLKVQMVLSNSAGDSRKKLQ